MKASAKSKPAKKLVRKAKKPAALPTVFTVRDLNRETAKVLAASKQHGRVAIRRRNGEEFTIAPAAGAATPTSTFEERMRLSWARARELGYVPPDKEGWEVISRAIAGE